MMFTPRSCRGFTLVELLVTMAMIGILANIAIPIYRSVTVRADAARVMSDFALVRIAAFEHQTNDGEFPPSAPWGVVPSEIVDELPDGFRFAYKDATYRWQRLGLGGGSGPSQLLSFEVQSANQSLLEAIMRRYEGKVVAGNGQIMFLID